MGRIIGYGDTKTRMPCPPHHLCSFFMRRRRTHKFFLRRPSRHGNARTAGTKTPFRIGLRGKWNSAQQTASPRKHATRSAETTRRGRLRDLLGPARRRRPTHRTSLRTRFPPRLSGQLATKRRRGCLSFMSRAYFRGQFRPGKPAALCRFGRESTGPTAHATHTSTRGQCNLFARLLLREQIERIGRLYHPLV